MQVHTRNDTVRQIGVGEYHAGAVGIYLGGMVIVTWSEDDCDALIAAACDAKAKHTAMLRPGPVLPNLDHVLPYLREKVTDLALPDCHDAAEFSHIAIEGTL